MNLRKPVMTGAVFSAIVLAGILPGCGPSTLGKVDEALTGLGAHSFECPGGGEGDDSLDTVIDSTSCWELEIESSISGTAMDVVQALQELDVAGDIEHESCTDKEYRERPYLPCRVWLMPEDGREVVYFVNVSPAIDVSDGPDEYELRGTPGALAVVTIGTGRVVDFPPSERVDED